MGKTAARAEQIEVPESYTYDVYAPVLLHMASFYERLALFNAGTVALTVNAALGSFHEKIQHRYTLRAGLVGLVLSIVALLARNLLHTRFMAALAEVKVHATLGNHPKYQEKADERRWKIQRVMHKVGYVGVGLTLAGLLCLMLVAVTSI